jgi:hypothetical protein
MVAGVLGGEGLTLLIESGLISHPVDMDGSVLPPVLAGRLVLTTHPIRCRLTSHDDERAERYCN